MSMPSRGTTFGEITIDGETFKIFSRPLSDEIAEKIHKYKTDGAGISTSAPWMTDTYKWSIVDNKLYLNEINILSFDQELYEKLIAEAGGEITEENKHHSKNRVSHSSDRTLEDIKEALKVDKSIVFRINSMGKKNIIQELFNTDKLFAQWQNKDIKILLSQESYNIENDKIREKVIQNVRVLKFQDGVLTGTSDEIEEYTHRPLKNYVER